MHSTKLEPFCLPRSTRWHGYSALLATCLLVTGCGDERKHGAEDRDASDGARPDGASDDSGSGDSSLDGEAATDARAPGSEAGTEGEGGSTGDAGLPFAQNDAGQVLCGSTACACSDGIDGDMDGLVDLADPECVASWDDDESSLATGISGDNRDDACQDCFFDGNSGAGNDGCRIPSSCLIDGTPSSGQGNCSTCNASDQCKSFCQAYTPNGCDCFGCCGVQLGTGIVRYVLIGEACDIDGNDSSSCQACVPSTSCANSCGRCELCPGKTLADLPADCRAGGGDDAGTAGDGGTGDGDGGAGLPTPSCDEGEVHCGAGLPACPVGEACTFGCCLLIPLL